MKYRIKLWEVYSRVVEVEVETDDIETVLDTAREQLLDIPDLEYISLDDWRIEDSQGNILREMDTPIQTMIGE